MPLAAKPLSTSGVWSNNVNDDRSWNGSIDFNTRSSRWGYGLAAATGFLGGGDYRYVSAYGWAKPSATTITNLTAEKLRNFGTFNQTVFSAGWDITPAHVVSGRVIDASYGRAYRLAYTWRSRRNTDFFLVLDRTSGQAVGPPVRCIDDTP